MIYWVTVVHMPVRVMKEARERIELTVRSEEFKKIDVKIFVDHHYPINRDQVSLYTREWARQWGAHVVSPPKNLGGHGGTSYALKLFPVQDDDIVFCVDPDSCPKEEGWVTAMVNALEARKDLGSISLMPKQIKARPWVSILAEPTVVVLDHPEMWNVTAFKGSMIKEGMKANSRFYGHVETAMWNLGLAKRLYHGYLKDFTEEPNPVAHDREYIAWKGAHAAGNFAGNFDEFMKGTSL